MVGTGNSADEVWKAYGRDDPYFGVLAHSEYSKENLTEASLEKFFHSGEADIVKLLSLMDNSGVVARRGRALDFGCGVGRLIIPLAKRFSEVIGVDVSEGMLAEASKNMARHQIDNASFYEEIPDREYDLVHSLFVFQHINSDRGTRMITSLWSKISIGGVLALQLPIYFDGRTGIRRLRDTFPMLQIPYNLIIGRRWDKPGMQMNIYDINYIAYKLLEDGATNIALHRRDSDESFRGVYLLASKGR